MDSFDQWIARARDVPIEREIERRGVKLNGNGRERVSPCPKCGGDDRFSINTAKGVWNCRGCGVGGDVIELVRHLDGGDFIAACTTLNGEPPPKANGSDRASEARQIVTAAFNYENADGSVAFAVERVEFQNADGTFVLKGGKHKKRFRQKRPDPDRPGKWIWNVDGVPVVPYRLPQLIEAVADDRPILIVEGEAKADLLTSCWNVAASCNAGGAKKWKPEHAAFLKGADVVLVPDHDDAGWQHINAVGASLAGIAKRIRVVVLPDLRPKGDVIDWARSGGTREQLDELIAEAKDFVAPLGEDAGKAKGKADEDALLEALVGIRRGVEYARRRKEAMEALGVSARAIDDEVEARRVEREVAPLYGHWITEPWPEPVDGDSLLRDIIRCLRRYVVCSHDDALAIALWIVLTWLHDIATHSPMLVMTSAEPMSGKTTALAVLSFLVPRSIRSVEISEAALYRSIELWHPTFVIDEFDSVLANKDKDALRSIINSGHTPGDGVIRCVGDSKTPQWFSTYGPKSIGMIGRKLPPQTLTRCIFIELRRRKKDEKVERFKYADDAELGDLRRRLMRYSMDNEDALLAAKPTIPAELENRYDDNWHLQFAIADLAGEDWGDQARVAAIKIERASDNTTASARLLGAICKIHGELKSDEKAIGSQALIDRLTAEPDSEWAEYRNGKPITQVQLARLLKPFRIFPAPVRVGGQQVRGYEWSWFEDAWSRYL